MKLYIAGPMRGHANYNFDAFDRAYIDLITKGHAPVSPADLDRAFEGYSDYPPESPESSSWSPDLALLKRCMIRDVLALFECEGIYLLNGWEKSKGATAEKALAEYLGLEVMYEE